MTVSVPQAPGGRRAPAAGLLLAAGLFGVARLPLFSVPPLTPETLPEPPGAALSGAGIAALPPVARRLMADFAWLAAVQYYGLARRSGAADFSRLEPLTELARRLDPGFRAPAVSGAMLLAEPPPLGPGEGARADALLAAWAAANPDDWAAHLTWGLTRHWHLQDPAGAGRIFAAAAARPDAPDWFTVLAARSFTEAGARETARSLWLALLDQAPDPRGRANARTHLEQLQALDRLDDLKERIREFQRRAGRRPRSFDELAEAGLLAEVPPRDPSGAPFVLQADGAPRISRASPLAGIPGH